MYGGKTLPILLSFSSANDITIKSISKFNKNLKTNWTENRVIQIQKEIGKLQPIFAEEQKEDFRVWLYKDTQVHRSNELYREKLLNCLNNKAVFKMSLAEIAPKSSCKYAIRKSVNILISFMVSLSNIIDTTSFTPYHLSQ